MAKTYNDLYIETRRAFRDAGIEAYALEARLIAAFAADKSVDKFLRDLRLYTGSEMETRLNELITRRLSGEPAAYITGGWEFYGLPIVLEPTVLIPRTDTELAVKTAVERLTGRKMDARVLDLCSGSGCIGCAIGHCLPATRVVMADISPNAVRLSRHNARINGLSARATCLELDALAPPPILIGSFDLIVSNPPYIASAELLGLDPSVRDFEPMLALDGGEDGLLFYRSILKHWISTLRPNGLVIFEVGEGQADELKMMMTAAGLRGVSGAFDTGGVERVVCGNI